MMTNFLAYYATLTTNDTKNLVTIMTFSNNLADNIFLPLMILVVWAIWVLGSTLIGKSFFRAGLFASFFCSVLSILFVLLNWLNVGYMYFCFLLIAIFAIAVWLSESFS